MPSEQRLARDPQPHNVLVLNPILDVGILLSEDAEVTDCERLLYKPLILVGVFLMLVSLSLTGFLGACFCMRAGAALDIFTSSSCFSSS
ncbi:hypothetical protein REPUB_Repub17cG0178100 [Reevesia pubescens]